ncbi:MAG: ABC transporter permease subunit [Clostridia bacterium]
MKRGLTVEEKIKRRATTKRLMKRNWVVYLFILPALAYIIIFNYVPLYGIQLAFKDYSAKLGVWGSEWIGLYWFEMFITAPRFYTILWNTVSLSLYTLFAGFPIPIILALLLNCMRADKYKRLIQTVTYIPHFISTVVLVGMMSVFMNPRSGFITTLLYPFIGESYLMGTPALFNDIYVWSGIWQSAGWGSIIYLAALSGVSPELHEAATIEGANRVKRIWYIDLPVIIPQMMILLVLNCGSIMSVGFEKAYLMQNTLLGDAAEIISTYVYKLGLLQQKFEYSTAIGIFNNVINFTILIIANKAAGLISGSSLW